MEPTVGKETDVNDEEPLTLQDVENEIRQWDKIEAMIPDEDKRSLGRCLALARHYADLKANVAARLLVISSNQLSLVENDHHEPSTRLLRRMRDVYGRKNIARALCHLREAVRFEVYRYNINGIGYILYDINKARECIAERSEMRDIEVPADEMPSICNNLDGEDEARIEAADPGTNGIGATLLWEGERVILLIDGQHRCAKAMRLGIPFHIDLLTDDDLRECIISVPMEGLIP